MKNALTFYPAGLYLVQKTQSTSQRVQLMYLRSTAWVMTIHNQLASFFCITEERSIMAGSIRVIYSVVSALSLFTVFSKNVFSLNTFFQRYILSFYFSCGSQRYSHTHYVGGTVSFFHCPLLLHEASIYCHALGSAYVYPTQRKTCPFPLWKANVCSALCFGLCIHLPRKQRKMCLSKNGLVCSASERL